jgi:KaiC/GvpD/RAD55 family RecA-like ATPase
MGRHRVPTVFRNSIAGLERLFKTDIVSPKVVLVTGPPGSLKSSFCFGIMSTYLNATEEFGLYTTLEESADSHVRNMKSLGMPLSDNMQLSDFTDLREVDQVVEDEGMNYLDFIERMVTHFKKLHKDRFTVFTLDSLGALYSLMEDVSDMRKKMFYFFKMLRDNNLISFVIMERALGGESQLLGNEGFLVDGIIHLGLDRSHGKLVRFLQVEKMRASKHSMEPHAIEIGVNGISVLGPIFEMGT